MNDMSVHTPLKQHTEEMSLEEKQAARAVSEHCRKRPVGLLAGLSHDSESDYLQANKPFELPLSTGSEEAVSCSNKMFSLFKGKTKSQ